MPRAFCLLERGGDPEPKSLCMEMAQIKFSFSRQRFGLPIRAVPLCSPPLLWCGNMVNMDPDLEMLPGFDFLSKASHSVDDWLASIVPSRCRTKGRVCVFKLNVALAHHASTAVGEVATVHKVVDTIRGALKAFARNSLGRVVITQLRRVHSRLHCIKAFLLQRAVWRREQVCVVGGPSAAQPSQATPPSPQDRADCTRRKRCRAQKEEKERTKGKESLWS